MSGASGRAAQKVRGPLARDKRHVFEQLAAKWDGERGREEPGAGDRSRRVAQVFENRIG
jgi:hypothetical protein